MAATNPPTDPDSGSHPIDPEEQRTWLAQLDRKLGTRTYAGAAALILALAAGIVAIVLAVDARDNSATTAEFSRLEKELGGVADDASASADAQENIDALSGRVDSLEDEISDLSGTDEEAQGRLDVIEDDIEDLRQEISDIGSAADLGGPGGTSPPDEGG